MSMRKNETHMLAPKMIYTIFSFRSFELFLTFFSLIVSQLAMRVKAFVDLTADQQKQRKLYGRCFSEDFPIDTFF